MHAFLWALSQQLSFIIISMESTDSLSIVTTPDAVLYPFLFEVCLVQQYSCACHQTCITDRNPSYPSNKSQDKMVIIHQWIFIAFELLHKLLFWLVGFEKFNFNAGNDIFLVWRRFCFQYFQSLIFCRFNKNMITPKAP